jgi:methylated-DNA-protein-cysteine methyltransferase-like protein
LQITDAKDFKYLVQCAGILMAAFFEKVYDILNHVPYGRVVSYGQIAKMLGRPRAAREVGWALRACPDHLPWQRVVRADGSVAGGAHSDLRKALLESEGVKFLKDGRVDMEKCQWDAEGYDLAP